MKNRKLESIQNNVLSPEEKNLSSQIIFCSPSDIGVQRNQGRIGARFAPKCILNQLYKLNDHQKFGPIREVVSTDSNAERIHFSDAQLSSATLIQKEIKSSYQKKFVHIGGGHDHIYPLLLGIEQSKRYQKVLILNIDAHCDTRVDDISHSGTPFRDYDRKGKIPFHLIQYGIDLATNSKSTLSSLSRGSESHLHISDIKRAKENISLLAYHINECPFEVDENCAVVISLDADGINGDQMPGVSAVNGYGVTLEHVFEIVSWVAQNLNCNTYLGVYEYNPVFDNLSVLGARGLARLIYQYLS